MRRAARVDANHAEIVAAFRDAGCSVLSLAAIGKGCPDLLVAAPNGHTCLVEVKDGRLPPSRRRLTPDEERWLTKWPGESYIAVSVEDARAIAEWLF